MTQTDRFPQTSYPADEFAPVLIRRLERLSYPAFAYCTGHVLLKLGYRKVRFSARRTDRNRTGSPIDFTATVATPLGFLPAGGQFKRPKGVPVTRPQVAALVAEARRRGFAESILIATGGFSGPAREEALSVPGRAVRLLDGRELARTMIVSRLGCVEVSDWLTGEPRYLMDEDFFAGMERRCGTASEDPRN